MAALLDEPSALVTAFVSGREMKAEELREPETIAEVAHDLRQLHDSGTELPTGFDSFRLVEEYAETGRAHGSEPPDGYDDALEAAHAIENGDRATSPATSRCRPTTTCCPRTSCATATACS